MADEEFSSHDLLVLMKAYDIAVHRHCEVQLNQEFWVTLNDSYNNHPDCRSRRQNWETRRGYIKFTNSCLQYLLIMDEVEDENIFQCNRITYDSRYLFKYGETFIDHDAFDIWFCHFPTH